MKAVIWTDVFQTFVMFAGMLAVFIQVLKTSISISLNSILFKKVLFYLCA